MKHDGLSTKNGERGYWLLLLLSGVGMLWLCLLDAFTLSDDMIYRFMFQYDENAPVLPVTSLSDLLHSQWVHYQTINGRFVVHLLAQAMLVFMPPWVYRVLHAVLFVVLLHLCVQCVARPAQRLFVAALMCLLLFLVFKDIRTTFLWSLGAFNYLWVLVATMSLLLFMRRIARRSFGLSDMCLLPLAFLVGFSHEGLSLPVSTAFMAYLFFNRHTVFRTALWPYMACYMLGTLFILLSPALWSRASEGVTLFSRLLSGGINLVFNVRIVWLLLLLLAVCWWRHREVVRQHFSHCAYVYIALGMSLVIVLLCGTNLERVPFFADFIALLLLLGLLVRVIGQSWQRRMAVIACAGLALLFVPMVMVRQANSDVWQAVERQMAMPGQELIAVPAGVEDDSSFFGFFRSRYVNPSVEFGYYCVYHGFNAADVNMRCAARLYGKERLVFLPEDVISHIVNDSTAYSNYGLDDSGLLYVWQLPRFGEIEEVTFVLSEEDLSSLSPLQRLVAYRDNSFTLSDFRIAVVEVCHRPFLVFTRPTTNIYRRIERIEYHYRL